MTPEDYFTNAVRMFLADGGTPESAHRLIDETATEPARTKPSREEVAGAPLPAATSEEIARAMGMATKPAGAKPSREEVEGAPPSPATSEEIARAIREAFAGNPPHLGSRPKIRKRRQ
jgi:hypothetical protein